MTFSAKVKEELSGIVPHKEHCLKAELQAFLDAEAAFDKAEILQHTCCKKAFLRGLFLKSGSIGDPEKIYHLEIVCETESLAEKVRDLIRRFELSAKTVERKGHYVVYLKEGDQIADFLALIQANVSMLNMENVLVVKDVRNNLNRQVNCETANIGKTVNAAHAQIMDIEFIEKHIGLENLPEQLREIARLRLENPEATLNELGEMLIPPVGKSGVNHRLRKLHEIAEEEKL